jgi:hypothetical protein
VLETPPELDRLQRLLDSSAAGAGEHLRSIITDERRLDAPGFITDDHLAVSAHGTATLFPFPSPDTPETNELRQAMLDHYLPRQGASFRDWLDGMTDGVAVRVDAAKLFVCSVTDLEVQQEVPGRRGDVAR